MNKKTKKSISYHHGNLKAALIVSALSIIDAEGISHLTLRKTARKTGVSHAAPAHHFKDLRGLLAAIAEQGFQLLSQAQKDAVNSTADDDPLTQFKALGMAYIEFALKYPSYFKVMFHPMVSEKSNYPELEKVSSQTYEITRNTLKVCQEKKVIVEDNLSDLSLFAWSAVHGFATLATDGQIDNKITNWNKQFFADVITKFVFMGLRK